MNNRHLLRALSALLLSVFLSACAYTRVDLDHFLLRSDVIHSVEQERAIVAKARLGWTDDGRVRVLYVQGTPYERGYQQGVLLRKEIKNNIAYIYDKAQEKFHSAELFAEVYERMRPYIPQEHIEEMHGLAHGSRLPLATIHHVHVLADMGEWGGKRRVKEVIKQMMRGDIGTSCSNLAANGTATKDGEMLVVRILDWGLHRISRLHEYPLITVGRPDKGVPYANIGWVGYLGAVSGMNSEGITLGEMGYGAPTNETLHGIPMPFLLRDVMTYSKNLADVRRIIGESPGSNSYIFVMSDGKTGEAEMYVRDRERFLVFQPNTHVKDKKEDLPPIANTVYGGRYNEKMTTLLNQHHGALTPELLKSEIIPKIIMPSNFQNVIYRPQHLQFWVNNAASKDKPAFGQPYTFFDLKKALAEYPGEAATPSPAK